VFGGQEEYPTIFRGILNGTKIIPKTHPIPLPGGD
jgi:hypothetical protein